MGRSASLSLSSSFCDFYLLSYRPPVLEGAVLLFQEHEYRREIQPPPVFMLFAPQQARAFVNISGRQLVR